MANRRWVYVLVRNVARLSVSRAATGRFRVWTFGMDTSSFLKLRL
jgi:hypothetical protein